MRLTICSFVPALLCVGRDEDGGDAPAAVRRPRLDLLVRRTQRLRLRPRSDIGLGRTVDLKGYEHITPLG